MAKKFDGVVEAIRYKNGQILTARIFERRGASFSDRLLMDRKELLERIKSGKKFVTGSRKSLLASTFETGKSVQVLSRDGKEIITTRDQGEHDELEQVPFF